MRWRFCAAKKQALNLRTVLFAPHLTCICTASINLHLHRTCRPALMHPPIALAHCCAIFTQKPLPFYERAVMLCGFMGVCARANAAIGFCTARLPQRSVAIFVGAFVFQLFKNARKMRYIGKAYRFADFPYFQGRVFKSSFACAIRTPFNKSESFDWCFWQSVSKDATGLRIPCRPRPLA